MPWLPLAPAGRCPPERPLSGLAGRRGGFLFLPSAAFSRCGCACVAPWRRRKRRKRPLSVPPPGRVCVRAARVRDIVPHFMASLPRQSSGRQTARPECGAGTRSLHSLTHSRHVVISCTLSVPLSWWTPPVFWLALFVYVGFLRNDDVAVSDSLVTGPIGIGGVVPCDRRV